LARQVRLEPIVFQLTAIYPSSSFLLQIKGVVR
jgi:hypothetical protein